MSRTKFFSGLTSRKMLLLNILLAIIYFVVITFGFRPGNHVLFYFLIAGEVFHLYQIIGFCNTIWSRKLDAPFDPTFDKPVDIFITVCGEPVDIVRETAKAALAMDYPKFRVYLLNDGFVAKKDNWKEIDALAVELGITSITRQVAGGAKAGNINHAMGVTKSPYFAVFDADHVPYPEFMKETMGYFTDEKMGFVQTPQFYKNQDVNYVTRTSWEQQSLFFGPIMSGKNRLNSAFMCGTNMILNREALEEVGGMFDNIAEDFLTSLFVHAKGWNSVYVPKVLAEGLAPEDFLSYYKQQFRWSRGSLEVIFKYNPLFLKGLSWRQRFQYITSASYNLNGLFVVIDALLPIIFLFTGITAVTTSTMTLAAAFLPYIAFTLFVLQSSNSFSYTFDAIAFSLSSFYLQLRAIFAVLTNEKTSFSVTSKQAIQGNFLYLTTPHITYIGLTVVGVIVGLIREGISASLLANLSWAVINCAVFYRFIRAASPERTKHRPKPVSPPPPNPSKPNKPVIASAPVRIAIKPKVIASERRYEAIQ